MPSQTTSFFDRFRLFPYGIAFLARKRTKLATQDAVVGVIDIAVEDVAGPIADFAPTREVSNSTQDIQIFAFEQSQRVGFRDPFAGGYLVVEVAQFTALDEEMH